jgi:uncharacterized protein (UPF0548 family)
LFLFNEPSPQRIARFLDAQRDASFSYDEVGASREGAKAPTGFAVDHNRARLGRGRDTFERAVVALYSWRMFDVGWARLEPADAPVEVGTTVAVLARHYGFHSLNPCRISYTIEEDEGGHVRRGFAYGMLPEHGESGEEQPAGPALAAPVRERLSTCDGESHQSRASRPAKLLNHQPRQANSPRQTGSDA